MNVNKSMGKKFRTVACSCRRSSWKDLHCNAKASLALRAVAMKGRAGCTGGKIRSYSRSTTSASKISGRVVQPEIANLDKLTD